MFYAPSPTPKTLNGQCRRNAPNGYSDRKWSRVQIHDWCGEWRAGALGVPAAGDP